MDIQTMVHIAFPDGLHLIERLYNDKLLDSAAITLRPPHTTCTSHENGVVKVPTRMCFTLETRSIPTPTWDAHVPLWDALLLGGAGVKAKTGGRGYEIGPGGKITESWELDDGMC